MRNGVSSNGAVMAAIMEIAASMLITLLSTVEAQMIHGHGGTTSNGLQLMIAGMLLIGRLLIGRLLLIGHGLMLIGRSCNRGGRLMVVGPSA